MTPTWNPEQGSRSDLYNFGADNGFMHTVMQQQRGLTGYGQVNGSEKTFTAGEVVAMTILGAVAGFLGGRSGRRTRRNPPWPMLALVGGGAVAVGVAVAASRAARKDVSGLLGLPPGALVRQLTPDEEYQIMVAYPEIKELTAGKPFHGIWIIRKQFAAEPTTMMTASDGGVAFLIEEDDYSRKMSAISFDPNADPGGVSF